MLTFILAISPFIVSALTGWIKTFPSFTNLSDSSRVPAVRALAAFISLAYTVIGFWINGGVDSSALMTVFAAFGYALVSWLGSLGVFHAFFAKPTAAFNGTTLPID